MDGKMGKQLGHCEVCQASWCQRSQIHPPAYGYDYGYVYIYSTYSRLHPLKCTVHKLVDSQSYEWKE